MQVEIFMSGNDRVGLLTDITECLERQQWNIIWCAKSRVGDHTFFMTIAERGDADLARDADLLQAALSVACPGFPPVVRWLNQSVVPSRASVGLTEIRAETVDDQPGLLNKLCRHLDGASVGIVEMAAGRVSESSTDAVVHIDLTVAPEFDDEELQMHLNRWNESNPSLRLVPFAQGVGENARALFRHP